MFTIEVDADDLEGFNAPEDVLLTHSIVEVDGVATLADDVNAFGFSQEAASATGVFTLRSAIDFILNSSDLSESQFPQTGATGSTPWNASVAAGNGSEVEDIVVGTGADWPDGEYRLVHLAMNEDGTEFTANANAVRIGEDGEEDEPDQPSPPPRRPPRDDDGADGLPSDLPRAETTGNAILTIDPTQAGSIRASVVSLTVGDRVVIHDSTGRIAAGLRDRGFGLSKLDVGFSAATDGDIEVGQSAGKPDATLPDPPAGPDRDQGSPDNVNTFKPLSPPGTV